MKKLTHKQKDKIARELRRAFEADHERECKLFAKAEIYRGKRGQVGAESSDEISKAVEQMVGSTVVDAGFVRDVQEGGLAFDFDKRGKVAGSVERMRLVIGYNDLGEWVEYLGARPAG